MNAAQLGKTALMGAIHENVLVYPACTSCIRANDRVDVGRQSSFDLLHVFKHPRTRPIKIGSVFKDHEGVGITEHRLRAHGFDVRRGQKLRDNRVRHLILDEAGWLPGPSGMNDDLHVGNIGQCIKRDAAQRPDPREHEKQRPRENKEPIPRTPVNRSGDHVTFLPWR